MNTPPLFFIGSLPHENPEAAIAFVKRHSSHLPFLPQLPEANPQEDMVGQVLRGIELGYWDENASTCLELFQNEFVDFPRYKIQIAGPYSVARAMSGDFLDIAPKWLNFWRGLRRQLVEAGFQGELWLQLDEPYWAKERELPDGYTAFLQEVRLVGGKMRLGIHSCATERPMPFVDHMRLLDFFSFDFLQKPLTAEEETYWRGLLQGGKILVLGLMDQTGKMGENSLFNAESNADGVWVSATCGLYGWTPTVAEGVFDKDRKQAKLT